jgi:hypothetical protein
MNDLADALTPKKGQIPYMPAPTEEPPLFDIGIGEVYSVNQEVPEHGKPPKTHGRNS